jgi:hypothetical protein
MAMQREAVPVQIQTVDPIKEILTDEPLQLHNNNDAPQGCAATNPRLYLFGGLRNCGSYGVLA